jgi:hypothetical protein
LFVEQAGGGVDDRLADGVFSFLAHGFVKVGVLLTDRSVLFFGGGEIGLLDGVGYWCLGGLSVGRGWGKLGLAEWFFGVRAWGE